jgi:hypothetical protein
MLTALQQQAIIGCLSEMDNHAQRTTAWPGPYLLATLRETPIVGHPDPSARWLGVHSVPVPQHEWEHPDGPIAGLRQASIDLHHPAIQAKLIIAPAAGMLLLAWVFMHGDIVIDDELGPVQVRVIDAVDVDDRLYTLTRLPGTPSGTVTVKPAGTSDGNGAVEVLRILARNLRTH